MVPAIVKIITGVGHAHATQAETAPESTFDRRAVLRPHEIQHGILACGLALALGCKGQQRQHCGQHHKQPGDLHAGDLHEWPLLRSYYGDNATRKPWVGYRTLVS